VAAVLAAGVGRLSDLLIPKLRSLATAHVPGGPVSLGVLSGAVLGAGALVTPLILFSGHHETQGLLDGGHSTSELIGLSLLKVGLVIVCLAGGWFGGQIFPLAFAGAAIALAFGQIVDSPSTMALAASGYVAACVVSLRKPILVLVIFMFLFPASTWLAMAISMGIASMLMSKQPVEHGGAH
jgi:H+/Cl- antiporter ClcA